MGLRKPWHSLARAWRPLQGRMLAALPAGRPDGCACSWPPPPSRPSHPLTPPPCSCHLASAAKRAYDTALANVDWLHGTAESLLTVTNLFIVLGLRDAIRKAEAANAAKTEAAGSADAAAAEEQPASAVPPPK
jgi:hypothetical protein